MGQATGASPTATRNGGRHPQGGRATQWTTAGSACLRAGQEARLPVRYLQYRGGEGMMAWALHRISGVAIWAFILLHVLDIWLVGANPGLYDEVLRLYASPIGRVGETLVGAGLLYHALNGLRIIVMDFWPSTTVWHKQLWYACWVIFFAVGIPGAYIILNPIWNGAPA
jgi:succinate dehydrogenase / fumarate reductase, cytochrome b subunit